MYQYYAYPQNTRPRISQMLVLPPFQRKGLGAEMLLAVQNHYCNNEKVVDITGEIIYVFELLLLVLNIVCSLFSIWLILEAMAGSLRSRLWPAAVFSEAFITNSFSVRSREMMAVRTWQSWGSFTNKYSSDARCHMMYLLGTAAQMLT